MTPTLTIHAETGAPQHFQLKAKGVLIGRVADCDICIPRAEVSRHHARIFQDPFGRWILEDLGSGNGTWVDGERIEACALAPGKKVMIAQHTLVFSQEPEGKIGPDASAVSKTTVFHDAGEVTLHEPAAEGGLSHRRMQQVNTLIERIAQLTAPAELYPESCRCIAAEPGQVAAVVRLQGAAASAEPELLAVHSGGTAKARAEGAAAPVHLSRRVLRAVRESGDAVIASNVPSAPSQMELTVIDLRRPRTVCAAAIVAEEEFTDALYLDTPSGAADAGALDFARAVARQVAFARKSLLLAEDRAQRTALDQQLDWARRIQERLMPQAAIDIPGVDTATCYRPAMWVGGDYCDLWQLHDGRLAVCVADVAGKGLPAAMVMSNLQATLRATMAFSTDLREVMDHVNRRLRESTPDDMFVTMFLGLYSPSDGKLAYANAGHMPPMKVLSGAGAAPLGEATGPPIGVIDTPFETAAFRLEPGAGLVLVTDGITEAESPTEELFGLDRLEQVLAGGKFTTAGQMAQFVVDAADAFRGHAPQGDDVTVLALLNITGQDPSC